MYEWGGGGELYEKLIWIFSIIRGEEEDNSTNRRPPRRRVVLHWRVSAMQGMYLPVAFGSGRVESSRVESNRDEYLSNNIFFIYLYLRKKETEKPDFENMNF